MKRLLIIGVIAAGLASPASELDELRYHAAQFDKAWDVFIRGIFGCPTDVVPSKDTCKDDDAHIDYRAWNRARELAKGLFELEERQ